jgi:hypothetical protein
VKQCAPPSAAQTSEASGEASQHPLEGVRAPLEHLLGP